METSPRVSVVIPTYNRAGLLKRAVESVLAQTFTDYEILIIDDGSTDDTESVVASLPGTIRYIRQANKGVSAARNLGMELAHGDLIAFLDDDDEWLPEKLARQVPLFDEARVGIAYCGFEHVFLVDDVTHIISPTYQGDCYRLFVSRLMVMLMATPGVILRREAIAQVGGFALELRLIEDNDLWIRVARHWHVAAIPAPMMRIYVHGNNTPKSGFLEAALTVARRAFDADSRFGFWFRRRVTANVYGMTSYAHYLDGQRGKALVLWLRALAYWPVPRVALAHYARRLGYDLVRLMPHPVRDSVLKAWRGRRANGVTRA